MAKVKKFSTVNIRKIRGGKDPISLVEEFILRRGFDPDECRRERNADSSRWILAVSEDEELEVLVESMKSPSETSIYMGINVVIVPVRGTQDVLVSALEIADGLVGIKLSLVGHFLVLSASLGLPGLTVEDLDYHYKLITAQQPWFREAITEELGWEEINE